MPIICDSVGLYKIKPFRIPSSSCIYVYIYIYEGLVMALPEASVLIGLLLKTRCI